MASFAMSSADRCAGSVPRPRSGNETYRGGAVRGPRRVQPDSLPPCAQWHQNLRATATKNLVQGSVCGCTHHGPSDGTPRTCEEIKGRDMPRQIETRSICSQRLAIGFRQLGSDLHDAIIAASSVFAAIGYLLLPDRRMKAGMVPGACLWLDVTDLSPHPCVWFCQLRGFHRRDGQSQPR
jgi:hypothetical protein